MHNAKSITEVNLDTKDIKLSNLTQQELREIIAEIIGEIQSQPMEWKAEIKKADNGLIVKFTGGDWEDTKVYQQKDDNDPEENFEHYVGMFYNIMDYFGDNPRPKYRKKYVNIEYVGDNEE